MNVTGYAFYFEFSLCRLFAGNALGTVTCLSAVFEFQLPTPLKNVNASREWPKFLYPSLTETRLVLAAPGLANSCAFRTLQKHRNTTNVNPAHTVYNHGHAR